MEFQSVRISISMGIHSPFLKSRVLKWWGLTTVIVTIGRGALPTIEFCRSLIQLEAINRPGWFPVWKNETTAA